MICKRVRERALALNFNASSLAAAIDAPPSSVATYWTGKRIWPTELLLPLSKILMTSIQSLITGSEIGTFEVESLDLVPVAEIDLAYGLGGEFADGPVLVEHLHFPRLWLKSITSTAPEMLTFARGRGDSMQPTLQDGDIVLIDRSLRSIHEQDGLWALTIGDIAMIKRLRIRGEEVTLLSDNDRVPDDRAHCDEVNIVGRIVFIGRRI